MESKREQFDLAVGKVLKIIERTADAGSEMPTNAVISEIIGYSARSKLSRIMARLVENGLIKVERTSRTRWRAQVVATGKWTAWRDAVCEADTPKRVKIVRPVKSKRCNFDISARAGPEDIDPLWDGTL